MLHTWYLANDWQFFMISPPIIYAYIKNRKIGYFILVLLTVLSVGSNALVTYIYDLGINKSGNEVFADWLYEKPWTRF